MSEGVDREIHGMDYVVDEERAVDNVLRLADELETEGFADVKPWVIARLLRVAVTDDMTAGFAGGTR